MTASRQPSGARAGERPSIRLSVRGSVPRVVVGGELDRWTARRLSVYLEHVTATLGDRIELDLRRVSAIDPAGVRLLVHMRRRFDGERLSILPSEVIVRTVHFVAIGERNRRGDDRASRKDDRASGKDARASGEDDRASGEHDRVSGKDDRGSGEDDRASGEHDRGSGEDDRASGG